MADMRCLLVGGMLLLFSQGLHAEEVRSHAVLHAFQRLHPCPSTGLMYGSCPGWVKDHILPLACGGPDSIANLQWQTVQAGKAKDAWERRPCGRTGP